MAGMKRKGTDDDAELLFKWVLREHPDAAEYLPRGCMTPSARGYVQITFVAPEWYDDTSVIVVCVSSVASVWQEVQLHMERMYSCDVDAFCSKIGRNGARSLLCHVFTIDLRFFELTDLDLENLKKLASMGSFVKLQEIDIRRNRFTKNAIEKLVESVHSCRANWPCLTKFQVADGFDPLMFAPDRRNYAKPYER